MSVFPEDNKQTLIAAIIAFVLTPAGVTLLLALAVTAGGVATFTYGVGKDVGISAAANYSTVDRLKLDNLAEEARKAAVELREATSRFTQLVNADESYKSLKKEFDKQAKDIGHLTSLKNDAEKQLQTRTAELNEARVQLSTIVLGKDAYAIPRGQAIMIADENLFMTLLDYSYGGTDLFNLSVNGKPFTVHIGDRFEVPGLRGNPCVVYVKGTQSGPTKLLISATCS